MLARKYIGRSADTMNSKDKDKALADIYMAFNDELKKSKEVKSDVALRREQIDNEMKDIRNRDRDELLSQRIRNYDPSISIKEKDAILGKIYDTLTEERNKLDKSSGKTTTLKPEIEFLPDRIGKPEITTLPYRPGTAEPMPLPYKPGTAKAEPLPYRPGQDNGYTNYPYYFKEEKTKGKNLLEDALRGTGVKNTNEPSVKMLSNRSDIQPVKYSMSAQNEGFTPRDENTIWNTINQLTYGDIDSVLAQEAERFGLPYSPDMNDIQKEKLCTIVYQYLYYELNVAKGADVTSPDQDKDVLQKLYEIEYNEGKAVDGISLAASAIGNVLFPQNTNVLAQKEDPDEDDVVNENCINGQGIEDNGIRNLKVGTKGTIAENGCGIIAIYNALTLNGIEVDFEDVLNDANNMDGLLLRGGKWGTNPNKIGNMLAEYGLEHTMYTKPKDFNDAIEPGGTYIVSFWNDTNCTDGAHIVTFTCDENGDIIVYNASNNSSTPFKYSSKYGKTAFDRYMQGRGNSMTLYKVG